MLNPLTWLIFILMFHLHTRRLWRCTMLAFISKNTFWVRIFLIQKDYNTTWYVSKSKYDYLLVRDWIIEFPFNKRFVLQNYLKFEQSYGMPARIQVLYERAITDFPISPDLWLDYTRYLDNTLKVLKFPLFLLSLSHFIVNNIPTVFNQSKLHHVI